MITELQLIAMWEAIRAENTTTCRGFLEAAQRAGIVVVQGVPIGKSKPPADEYKELVNRGR